MVDDRNLCTRCVELRMRRCESENGFWTITSTQLSKVPRELLEMPLRCDGFLPVRGST